MENVLSAGFSRVTMTPAEPLPLGGFGVEEKRMHETLGYEICVSALALTDSRGQTLLLFSVDLANADTPLCQRIREQLEQETGIKQEHIYICATHSHSAPAVRRTDMDCIRRYNEQVCGWFSRAAAEALEDRKPCAMYAGSIESENLNFVKHYKARDRHTGQLSVVGDLFGDPNEKILLEHISKADPTVHLVRLERSEGRDIVLTNFRAHPHFDGGLDKHILSADYIGAFRTALEALEDCHAIYFQGACGNINHTSRMKRPEQKYHTAKSYGVALAAVVAEGLARHMTPCQDVRFETEQFLFAAQVQRFSPALLEGAQKVQKAWLKNGSYAQCAELAKPYGIRSPYHAASIISSIDRPDSVGEMLLNVVRLGKELAFATFPGEMFDTLSVRIEDNAPFPYTLLLGYCNHNMSYLPSMKAYNYTCYETDITRFAAGTGEKVADACIDRLNKLHSRCTII